LATAASASVRGLHTWQRHAAQARQGEPMLVSAAPGNQRLKDVGLAFWRDALPGLRPR
jgi:hypothetical protein